MSLLDDLREKARSRGRRVVLPETQDERVLRAAQRLASEGLATPILVRTRGMGDAPAGCEVVVEDPEFAEGGRDAVYYARAVEAQGLAIHADPLRCTTDQDGGCIEVDLCNATTDWQDDCLDWTEERAWSSPIFVDYAAGP